MTWGELLESPAGQWALLATVGLVISGVKNLLDRLGLKTAAERVGTLEGGVDKGARIATAVAKGLEIARRDGKITPDAFAAVAEVIRGQATSAGVQDLLHPLVLDVRDQVQAEATPEMTPAPCPVERATARLAPRRVA